MQPNTRGRASQGSATTHDQRLRQHRRKQHRQHRPDRREQSGDGSAGKVTVITCRDGTDVGIAAEAWRSRSISCTSDILQPRRAGRRPSHGIESGERVDGSGVSSQASTGRRSSVSRRRWLVWSNSHLRQAPSSPRVASRRRSPTLSLGDVLMIIPCASSRLHGGAAPQAASLPAKSVHGSGVRRVSEPAAAGHRQAALYCSNGPRPPAGSSLPWSRCSRPFSRRSSSFEAEAQAVPDRQVRFNVTAMHCGADIAPPPRNKPAQLGWRR